MAVFDNSPTKSYVRMTGIIVTYNDKIYNVEDYYTMKKYIYWDLDNPYILQSDNLMPDKSLTKFLVMINDNGMSQPVENNIEKFNISFDGNDVQNIKNNIIGIHKDVGEMGEKYAGIEASVEGVKSIVGVVNPGDGTISEQLTTLKQTSSDISLHLEKTDKEFADNKEMELLRENINKAFMELTNSLGIALGDIGNMFHDTTITEEEDVAIKTHIEMLRNKEANLYLYLDKVITLMEQQGQTEKLNALNLAKQLLADDLQELDDVTKTVIQDGTIVNSENITITSLFGKVSFSLEALKNTVDDILFLGTGGVITEWLSDIVYTVNGVKETFSKTITNMKTQTRLLKVELQGQVDDIISALHTYKTYVNDYFSDYNITQAEKEALIEKGKLIEKERDDLTVQYNKYKDDLMIGEDTKKEMASKYNLLINADRELMKDMEKIIGSNTPISDADKLRVEAEITRYETSVNNFLASMNKGLDEFDINKFNKEIEEAKNTINKEITEVKDSVTGLRTDMEGTFKDNVIDETERENIKRDIELINKEKTDVDNQYILYNGNPLLDGSNKVSLQTSYNDYILKYNELKSLMDGILAKQELVTDKDKQDLELAKNNLYDKLNIFLDASKKAVTYINTKEAEKIKSDITGEFGDVSSQINGLRDEMQGAFKDGILDEIELGVLEERLKSIEKEKKEIDEIAESLLNNPDFK